MRVKSETVKGVQVFAVAGTNTVSFGIRATATARKGLLGFAIERVDRATGARHWVDGYKVFRSLVPDPTPATKVSTYDHPIQSLVWDDFVAEPGHAYEYVFHPLKGTPSALDRSAPPVAVSVDTEPLSGGDHDIVFNRGVTSSQFYANRFGNLPPDRQPTPEKRAEALAWLSRDLDEAIIGFIASAGPGDAIRGCFYEFRFPSVLAALKDAIDRGVDVRVIVDLKVNERTIQPTPRNGLKTPKFEPSNPRVANLAAIAAAGLPDEAIIPRVARRDDIQHNKFMVLLRGAARTPVAVWTGSTNVTDGGIYGQANVGHLVRDATVAAQFLAYWSILAQDPGAATDARKDPINIGFLQEVGALTPTPTSIAAIPRGTTPLFSPRGDTAPLDLYVRLLTKARRLSCGTFAFGIPQDFRRAISANGVDGPLCFLLLEEKDDPRPTKANPGPVVRLNSRNNTYKAQGSELHTTLGRWVAETNNAAIKLNLHVTYIHLKFILHDPLGPDPIVVTGSANFSSASTIENDENMLLIRGDRRVADIYFTEFNRLWGHYQYRSVVEATSHRKPKPGQPAPHDYQNLWENTDWQQDYQPGDLRSKRVDQYVKMAI
ncbi:phosphatidylserine/phosphatidylglycerophosphate/cardiolipin synthase-like enzyme [Agromyces sp. 3263]|uniref:phospholipase D-like domain-containing protein n=1 Tax=Agromyces sp. 3263 TaxID=2817750 RepID=UPI00286120AF|nr:phospholipase D-like domain-containing protein [Agromyces sp. 3263]MDR6907808.1 phosphatidylserine/phosphatidylglycerophosphate/cardiolipin synthase-like enzyme [Agromyces sp. 3263]